jgi:hypothetical protein
LALAQDVVLDINGPVEDRLDDFTDLEGAQDYSAQAGSVTINIGTGGDFGAWRLDADSVLSANDDTVNIGAGGYMHLRIFDTFNSTTAIAPLIPNQWTVDFGGGSDVVNNEFRVLVGVEEILINLPIPLGGYGTQNRFRYEADMVLENLETFNNNGEIWLGTSYRSGGDSDPEIVPIANDHVRIFPANGTDRAIDDMLSMEGTHFVGGEGSRIFMDVDLNHGQGAQTACDNSQRDADGDFPAADCLNLKGGSATGRTGIVFNQTIPGDRGAFNPEGTVIVDTSGGTGSDPRAFVVDPEALHYSPQFGGIVDKGLFAYIIGFDGDTQQYKLYGVQAAGAQQSPLLAHAANDLWRTTTNAWFGRQVDQRDLDLGRNGGGTWIHFASNTADHDVLNPVMAGVTTFEFDNSYTQDNSSVTVGRDWIVRNEDERAWLIGGMVGYNRGRVDFNESTNTANLEGAHFGFYGGFTTGEFYLDAAVNGVWSKLDNDIPQFQLSPEGTILSTDAFSIGGQLEAGWRTAWGVLGVEPLATLSYVQTEIDDISVPADDPVRFGGEVKFDNAKSMRGGLGVRLSIENLLPSIAPVGLTLTAKAIEEFDGKAGVTIENIGPDAPWTHTFDGTFGQVSAGVNVTNTSKTVEGYLSLDSLFQSDYEALGIEAGFRYQW